jgi:thaumarchaeosortase
VLGNSDFRSVFQKIELIVPKTIVLLSFSIPTLMLYVMDESSFSMTWKGRTFYLFFLWLIFLEIILSWDDLQPKLTNKLSPRMAINASVLCLPTIYVIAANYWGLNNAILDLSTRLNVPLINWMPLSIEYLVFTGLFIMASLIILGFEGWKNLLISTSFLGAIGTIYTIDNLYPYGYFAPFQIFVPTSAFLAANVLNFMGYQTSLGWSMLYRATTLSVHTASGQGATFAIGWPCAGVQSLVVYSFVILIFFKKTRVSVIQRIIYFLVGAIITYVVNIFRIASIYLVYINNLQVSEEAAKLAFEQFHNYYGGLYSMTWILSYPLIIIGTRMLWARIKAHKLQRGLSNP